MESVGGKVRGGDARRVQWGGPEGAKLTGAA